MRISDLQAYLARVKRKHGDIEVIEQWFSDYGSMCDVPKTVDVEVQPNYGPPLINWAVVLAAPQQNGEYFMRDHRSLTEEQRRTMNFQPMLLYKGN